MTAYTLMAAGIDGQVTQSWGPVVLDTDTYVALTMLDFESGQRIGTVQVQLFDHAGNLLGNAQTGGRGSAALEMAPGQYSLLARAPGYPDVPAAFTVPAVAHRRGAYAGELESQIVNYAVVMSRRGAELSAGDVAAGQTAPTLYVHVFAADNVTPVSGAVVDVYTSNGSVAEQATTDASGLATFTTLQASYPYTFQAHTMTASSPVHYITLEPSGSTAAQASLTQGPLPPTGGGGGTGGTTSTGGSGAGTLFAFGGLAVGVLTLALLSRRQQQPYRR